MATAPSPLARRSGGWVSLLSLLLCLDLATCQTSTFKFASTPTNFQGFYVANPTSVEEINCATTRTWTTSGSYGACCIDGTVCTYYTDCKGGTVTRMDGSFWTCSADFPDCFTMTVLPSSPYLVASSSWLVMGCGKNWKANTVYREVVPTAGAVTTITAEPSTSPSSSASSATQQTSEPGAAPGQGTDPAQQTDAPPPADDPPEPATESSSKAWIAGAVIGPLVAVAALGFLFFWLGKRRGGKAASAAGYAPPEQQQYASSQHSPMVYDPVGGKHEMPVYYQGAGGYPQHGYYPSQSPPVHELPPAGMGPQELPGR